MYEDRECDSHILFNSDSKRCSSNTECDNNLE